MKENRILRILRDSIWEFVAVIVGIVAIIAMYNVSFSEQEKRALQLVILTNTSLVEVEPSVSENIRIYYGERLISNLSVITIKLENTGNQPTYCSGSGSSGPEKCRYSQRE